MVNGEGLLSKIVWVRIYAAKNIKFKKKIKISNGMIIWIWNLIPCTYENNFVITIYLVKIIDIIS